MSTANRSPASWSPRRGGADLDEAARIAGISKGGVLYHFKQASPDPGHGGAPSRPMRKPCSRRITIKLAPGPNRWARALVETSVDPGPPAPTPPAVRAAGGDCHQSQPAGTARRHDRHRLPPPDRALADPSMALLVALAMDGLWLHRLVRSPVMDESAASPFVRRPWNCWSDGATAMAPVKVAQ